MTDTPAPVKKKAPTLYVIIALKMLKGLFFVALAITAYTLSDNDLPAEYDKFLHSGVFHFLRMNPERKFWVDLAKGVGDLTEQKVLWAAAGTLVYSLFSLVEAVGLMFRIRWIGWMTIGESAFFIPIEVYELVHMTHADRTAPGHPITVVLILAFNILIVWYLVQNRTWLFHHAESETA